MHRVCQGLAMLSIHYNFNAASITRRLGENQRLMGKAMERISTGLRINSAADGPADLIMSEQLRSQIAGLERAMQNATTTSNVLGTAEGGLGQAASLLQKMRNLALSSLNSGVRSKDQIAADQSYMDSALQALQKILGATSMGGMKILENLRNKGIVTNPNAMVQLDPANIVAIPETYLRDKNTVNNLDATALGIDNPPQVENGKLANGDKTFVLSGLTDDPDEVYTLQFAEGDSVSDVIAKLKEFAIPDEIAAGLDDQTLSKVRTGSDINEVELDAARLAHLHGLNGEDAEVYLSQYMNNYVPQVTIGEIRQLTDEEKALLDLGNKLSNTDLTNLGQIQFLDGYDKDGNEVYSSLSLNDLFSGGAASLYRDPESALRIIDQALKSVTQTRADIGAAMSTMGYGQGDLEALTRMESGIRDSDFAEDVTEFARTQMFQQVCINLLGQVQKQNQQILDLLA